MFGKNKIAALVAEFFGTAVLTLTILSVTARTSFPFFAAISAGLVAGLMVLIIGKASGAHINPAVTLGLWSQRKIQTSQALVYIGAQLLGGMVAWRLGEYLLGQPTEHIAQWGLDMPVLVAEVIGAFIFGFGVAAAVSGAYEGGKLATVIGGSLAMGILVASLASNGIINPAVALGIDSMSWAYGVGPVLGAVLGMSTHTLLFEDSPAKKPLKKRK